MKQSLFDDLARTLATPMPRRGAVRTIAAALALGTFRALRPGWAFGSTTQCPASVCRGADKYCCIDIKYGHHAVPCCRPNEDCCKGPNDSKEHPNQMTWCCPNGKCGASGAKCKEGCDSDEQVCEKACCKPGEFCASFNRSLCCKLGGSLCAVAGGGQYVRGGGPAICCDAGTTCCFNATRATCCDANTQRCVNGACGCVRGATPCGAECCPDKWNCCSTAAGSRCCKPGEHCASIASAPGNKNCCPAARIATPFGIPVCCGTDDVATPNDTCCPPDNPNCCSDADGIPLACLKNTICVRGQCVPI